MQPGSLYYFESKEAAFTLAVDEAERMLAERKFTNVVTIVALQWLLLNRMQLRDRWGAFRR